MSNRQARMPSGSPSTAPPYPPPGTTATPTRVFTGRAGRRDDVSANLIGRGAEWGRLDVAGGAAGDGPGRPVLGGGGAGMGKTALAEERAAAAGGAVLRGTGAPGAHGA